jgi:hypothetical protein
MNKPNYFIDHCPETGLYGIAAGGQGLLYEAGFKLDEAQRLLQCIQADDELTWEDCAPYVEGKTDQLPTTKDRTRARKKKEQARKATANRPPPRQARRRLALDASTTKKGQTV